LHGARFGYADLEEKPEHDSINQQQNVLQTYLLTNIESRDNSNPIIQVKNLNSPVHPQIIIPLFTEESFEGNAFPLT